MSLRKKQSEFARLVPRLYDKAYELGFEITLGDAYRDPRVHGDMGVRKSYSHPNSAHKLRLAVDFNLFLDGEFLEGSESFRPIGEWWEQQHPDARWGGRFNDGNHFSFEHNGVK